MGARETVEVTGHLMDSGILSRVLDDIREYGGDFVIEEFDVGHEAHDPSSARITVEAPDDESLQRLLMRLQTRGVNQLSQIDDPLDACFSCGFGKIARHSKVAVSTYLPALLAVDKIIRH